LVYFIWFFKPERGFPSQGGDHQLFLSRNDQFRTHTTMTGSVCLSVLGNLLGLCLGIVLDTKPFDSNQILFSFSLSPSLSSSSSVFFIFFIKIFVLIL
jgi:hypothetical protein